MENFFNRIQKTKPDVMEFLEFGLNALAMARQQGEKNNKRAV
jgi:hypothetical protein